MISRTLSSGARLASASRASATQPLPNRHRLVLIIEFARFHNGSLTYILSSPASDEIEVRSSSRTYRRDVAILYGGLIGASLCQSVSQALRSRLFSARRTTSVSRDTFSVSEVRPDAPFRVGEIRARPGRPCFNRWPTWSDHPRRMWRNSSSSPKTFFHSDTTRQRQRLGNPRRRAE